VKTIELNIVDKTVWGRGDWLSEPDKVQWEDQETGLPCLAVRNPTMGHWCGYVGVSEGHPFFNIEYNTGDPAPDCVLEIHGGIAFSDFCQEWHEEPRICHEPEPGEPDRVWWLGFDCAHHGDMSPGSASVLKRAGFSGFTDESYKSLEYVKGECRSLAEQLKALAYAKS
jgi:hypothetical protein